MKRLSLITAAARCFGVRGFLCLACVLAALAVISGGGLAWGAASGADPATGADPAPGDGAARQTPQEVLAAVRADAERGDPRAMFAMGGLYVEGLIVQRNYSIAREWYEKSANAGLPEGIFNVGVCWETGMGSAADAAKAAEFFKRAADMNLPQALFKMSVILDGGLGVERDQAASADYLKRAAEARHPDAAAIWGLVCLNGANGEKPDGEKGLVMLKIAAEAGNIEAMKNIAVVYKDGIETQASPLDALKWYLIAEKCGYPKEGLDAVKSELQKKLKKDQQKKAEADADAWIKAAVAKRNG
jgi:TPR repeat protein